MYFLTTTAMLAIGIWMLVRASRTRKELARYEFEHRKDEGTVRFESFEASEKHRKRNERIGVLVNIGMLLVLVGGLGLLAGVALPRFLV